MLLVLATHPGIVFSREALLTRVWPDHTFVTERSVDSLVKRLRRRIEKDPANPDIILTVWGSGYKALMSSHSTRRDSRHRARSGQSRRSLYWRIGFGFILFLAITLILQVGAVHLGGR